MKTLVCIVVASACVSVAAQGRENMPPHGGPRPPAEPSWSAYPAAELLRFEGVRRELKLSKAQDAEVMAVWVRIEELAKANSKRPPQEREMVSDVIRVRESAVSVLTGSQRQRLMELTIQAAAPLAVAHPAVRAKLDLSEDQVQRILQAYYDWTDKANSLDAKARNQYWTEQKSALEKAIYKALTSEQLKKFNAMQGTPADKAKVFINKRPVIK